jgi:hypothetical protein
VYIHGPSGPDKEQLIDENSTIRRFEFEREIIIPEIQTLSLQDNRDILAYCLVLSMQIAQRLALHVLEEASK